MFGRGIVPSPERLLLAIKTSIWWCGWFPSRLDIAQAGVSPERLGLSGRSRIIGLEIERDSVPPEPGLKIRDPLLVCVELLLLALHLGCLMESSMSAEASFLYTQSREEVNECQRIASTAL